ncbi:hypothetical protein NE237_019864 [Protea cynaroides]|uniref:Uncharacterized protein n=1 Tax=Protea cynaroides TaxID=273540 RepID=A0A9Q0H667_9MAGN|nr:hypothetical protein NE237_019864 [Protea cynaroides]
MSSAGGWRRRILLSVIVLLIISVLQVWVCPDCMVRAIRIFPGNGWETEKGFIHNHNNKDDMNEKKKKKKMKKSRNGDLFNKFFSGRSLGFKLNKTQNVFEESKRKVPSCPDPLHN